MSKAPKAKPGNTSCPLCGGAPRSVPDVAEMDEEMEQLSIRIAEAIVRAAFGKRQYLLAEAAVRGCGLVVAACAKPGDRAAALRLGAAMLNALAALGNDGAVN